MKEIELPNGDIAEFPDDMPDDQIAAVLAREFPPPPPQESALNRFSQGAIAGGAAFLDFLGRPVPGSEGLPIARSLPQLPQDNLAAAEAAGLTQPGALARTDIPSVLGRAASGIPAGLLGGVAGGGALARVAGQELLAAGGSAAGELAGQAVGGDLGGTVGAIAGGIAAPASVGPSPDATRAAATRGGNLGQAFAAGQRLGQPLQLADVNPALRRVQAWLESVPLTGGARRRAQRLEGLRSTTEEVASRARNRMQQLGWDDLNTVRKAAAGGGPRSREANFLLEAIDATVEDDLDRVIGVSQRLELFKTKLTSDELYAKAARLSNGAADVPRKTLANAQSLVGRFSTGVGQDTAAVQRFQTLAEELASPQTMEGMRVSRSNLLEMARDTTNLSAKGALESLADSLNSDLESLALRSGQADAFTAIQAANKHYRKQVVRRRDSALAKALNKTDLGGQEGQRFVEDVVKQFLNPNKAESAAFTWGQLGKKGKAAVMARVFRDGFDRATLRANDGTAVFSPAQFANHLENHGPFLARVGKQQVNGLAKLMRAVSREASPGASPFTGGRVADQLPAVGLGAALIAEPALAGAAWLTAAGMQRILERPAGRGLIAAAAKAPNQRNLIQISARLSAIASREED